MDGCTFHEYQVPGLGMDLESEWTDALCTYGLTRCLQQLEGENYG